jgi:hypothetical protein
LHKSLSVPRQFQPQKNLLDFEFGQLFLSKRRAYDDVNGCTEKSGEQRGASARSGFAAFSSLHTAHCTPMFFDILPPSRRLSPESKQRRRCIDSAHALRAQYGDD